MWGLGRVDPAAQLVPAPSAGDALRDAIPAAEHVRDTIHRRLDEIAQLAPPEGWLPEWSVEDARAYIATAKWRRARPPQPPHEYTVRGWEPRRRQDFLAFAQLIQVSGVLKVWGDFVHAYLEVDGLEYWTMGARVIETTVINRALVGASEAAHAVAARTGRSSASGRRARSRVPPDGGWRRSVYRDTGRAVACAAPAVNHNQTSARLFVPA